MELITIVDDITNKNSWKNKSRIIGEACEIYVQRNVKCFRCYQNTFYKCKTNEKSKDLICVYCQQKYQVKAKSVTNKSLFNIKLNKTFKTIGGDYLTTLNSINQNIDYLIVLYDKYSNLVREVLYVEHENVSVECVIPRKPLSLTAKRSGWQGCYIKFKNIKVLMSGSN
jgi:type II restriction enzyme